MAVTTLIPDFMSKTGSRLHKPALVDAGRIVSYAEAEAEIEGIASACIESGMSPGQRLAVLLPNSTAFPLTVFGIIKAGLIPAVFHPKIAPAEVDHLMRVAEPSGLVADARLLYRLADAFIPWVKGLKFIAVSHGEAERVELIAGKLGCEVSDINELSKRESIGDFPERNPNDGAVIVFTTGTTGKPKGVLLSHRNLLSVAEAVIENFSITPDDITLIMNPMAHISAFTTQMIAYPLAGATCCIVRDLSFPREVIKFGCENNVTTIHGMPTSLMILAGNLPQGGNPLEGLRLISLSGERVSRRLLDRLIDAFPGVQIYNSYGLTEASPRITAFRIDEHPELVDSVGPPLSICEVKVVDESGNELPTGLVGELLVKSPGNMIGYFHDDEATSAALDGEWLHTRDLARLDESGNIYLEARISEMINVGGEKVNPLQVEEAIETFPGVESSLVLKKAHEIMGEVPVALVIRSEGADFDKAKLLRFLKQKLSSFKIPVEVHFVNDFPRIRGGKVLRRLPREMDGEPR